VHPVEARDEGDEGDAAFHVFVHSDFANSEEKKAACIWQVATK
jgi:hypothetical protein